MPFDSKNILVKILSDPITRFAMSGTASVLGKSARENAAQFGRGAIDITPIGDALAIKEGISERDLLKTGLGVASLALPGTIKSFKRPVPENISVGPISTKSTVIGGEKPLFRETDFEGLKEQLRLNMSGGGTNTFVTDDIDLALGQGKNKGILIEYNPERVSGVVNKKPGTGIIGGDEYVANFVGDGAISKITIKPDAKIKKATLKQFLRGAFSEKVLEDGTKIFSKK